MAASFLFFLINEKISADFCENSLTVGKKYVIIRISEIIRKDMSTMAAKRKSHTHKKRTISPEQIAKMQEGRKRAAERRQKASRYDNIEKRLSLKDD